MHKFTIATLLALALGFGGDGVVGVRPSVHHRTEAEHLTPVEGFFSSYDFEFEYYVKVRQQLLAGASDEPWARMVVLPSFAPEYAVAIELEKGLLFAKTYTMDRQIWTYEEMRKGGKAKPDERPKLVTRSASLGGGLGRRIQAAWWKSLATSRWRTEPFAGLDGTDYYFMSFEQRVGIRAAKAWSPSEGLPKLLVEVGTNVASFVRASDTKRDDARKQIKTSLARLEAALEKSGR